jgi:hypothetical protein
VGGEMITAIAQTHISNLRRPFPGLPVVRQARRPVEVAAVTGAVVQENFVCNHLFLLLIAYFSATSTTAFRRNSHFLSSRYLRYFNLFAFQEMPEHRPPSLAVHNHTDEGNNNNTSSASEEFELNTTGISWFDDPHSCILLFSSVNDFILSPARTDFPTNWKEFFKFFHLLFLNRLNFLLGLYPPGHVIPARRR